MIQTNANYSSSKGNSRGNQLLDGLINLSPLDPDLTIDLHVRTAVDPRQSLFYYFLYLFFIHSFVCSFLSAFVEYFFIILSEIARSCT